MLKAASFNPVQEEITSATEFVGRCFNEYEVPERDKTKGIMFVEEALGSLISQADGKGKVFVSVKKVFGNVSVEISVPGHEYPLMENISMAKLDNIDEYGHDAQDTIRNIVLKTFIKDFKYVHKNGYNKVDFSLIRARNSLFFIMLLSLVISILMGTILSMFASPEFNKALDYYVLTPGKTIYINFLKVIIAPVVFFSLVSCISSFTDLRQLGKFGRKTMLLYTITSIIAVMVGIGVFYIFEPGKNVSMASTVNTVAIETPELSIRDMIVGMFPSNYLSPFINNNMPQLIILAFITGIATGMLKNSSSVLMPLFDAFNELFMKLASIIINFMPIVVVCSVTSVIITTGANTLLSLMGMFATFIVGLLIMMIIYIAMIAFIGRMDPIPLIKKYFPTMLQVFSIAASNAAIPINMEVCEKKLGVSHRASSLAIPLGSTLNMDGTCVQLAVFALGLANVYGVVTSTQGLIAFAITIVLLSMGAPGLPGGTAICLALLLEQLGVPTEAVGMVVGIGPLIGMFLSMSNCLGDVVVTTIVAKLTKELDMEVYRKS